MIMPSIGDIYKRFRRRLEGKERATYRLSSGETYFSGKRVGGMWDEIGELQFNFLVKNGLKPRHKLLDIGCGSLRGGVHFVRYLESGNYYGMDRDEMLLNAAREVELPRYGLSGKAASLVRRDDFDFSVFGAEFDYALAQSVFTHLPWNSIMRCLVNVERTLQKDGRFYATFFEDKNGGCRIAPMTHAPGGVETYPDKDPFHYEFGVFEELSARVSLEVEYIGEWGHPRGQMMMVFTRPARG